MTLPALLNETWIPHLTNHLWQSTVVAAFAWLLAPMLSKNPARTRYWVWMVASAKFLLPFSLLIAAGEWLRSLIAAPIVVNSALANVTEKITQPVPQTRFLDATSSPNPAHHFAWILLALLAAWLCGALLVAVRFGRGWWMVWSAKRAAKPLALAAGVPVLCSPALIEPGIFGILRPVLLMPEGILDRLTPEQLKAIIAHEMCHVRRRDNLTFAFHMFVETLLWFYPPVWWIGVRLIEERERACDEAVLQAGSEAEVYAEGILNVCKFYAESPLECVAGVTGADLKMRIVRIMARHVGLRMSLGRKLLLGAAATLVMVVPVVFGVLHATQIRAQSQAEDAANKLPAFEVVSIRPNNSGARSVSIGAPSPDTFRAQNVWLRFLIQVAWDVKDFQVLGGPGWATSDRYDVTAKAAENARFPEMRLMLRALLEDRFQLKLHTETRELPIYALVVGKGDVKLQPTSEGSCAMPSPDWPASSPNPLPVCGNISARPDGVDGIGVSMAQLALSLSNSMQRTVVDQTALTGKFDVHMKWAADQSTPGFWAPGFAPAPSADASTDSGPSIFTVIREQLGLALEARKGPVTVLVIDHIEQPSPN